MQKNIQISSTTCFIQLGIHSSNIKVAKHVKIKTFRPLLYRTQ